MALRVWLPLNGNLNNQGLSNLTFSNTNTTNLTIDTGGKIGSCYQRATKQTAGYITSNKTILLDNDITMCCWALVSDGVASANGLITNHNHSTNTGVGLTFKYISSTDFRISCNTGTGSGRTYDTYYGTTNIKDAWHHLALTYDNTAHQLLLYVDGIIEYTLNNYTNASQEDWIRLFEWSTNYDNTNYRPAVKLNDVRIYDECLSQKQIKEISKGLVAHYKLDTMRAINNLKRDVAYGVYNNFSSSGSTCTVVATGEYYNGSKIYRMTYTPNDTSLSSVQTTLHSHGVTTSGMTFVAGTKYCYWTLCKPISHPDTVVGGVASNIGYWTEIPMQEYGGGWYVVGQKRTGNAPEDKSDTIFTSFKTPSAESGVPIIIDFCCPHLVSGYDYILPEFDYQGTNLTYESDVSGNGYNGIVSGTLNYNIDSPRYSGSTVFDNINTNYIYRDTFNWLNSPYTFNCWVYQTSATTTSSGNTGTTLQFIESQGRDCGYAGFSLCSANGYARLYIGTATTGTYYTINDSTINLLNNWHMITGTYDGTTAKLYVDGVLKGTKDTSIEPVWTEANGFTLGKMAYAHTNTAAYFPFVGSISDARVYATALTADDILTLYKTSGIIDNKGNIYAYEFKEE